jgi:ketosteroid isomerase-like protein
MPPRLAVLVLSAAAFVSGCSRSAPTGLGDQLIAADKAFSALSAKEGPKAAYADTLSMDAKLLNQYRIGTGGIQDMFLQLPPEAKLTWEPSFVDIASSGDLGYTWGRYTLLVQFKGIGAKPLLQMGNYIHVWRRDRLGHWRIAFIGGNPDGQK